MAWFSSGWHTPRVVIVRVGRTLLVHVGIKLDCVILVQVKVVISHQLAVRQSGVVVTRFLAARRMPIARALPDLHLW